MTGYVPPNYGSIAERVPEVGFSGGGSVYDQKEADVLAENVSKLIYSINNERKSLEKSVKSIGTSKDSQELRDKMQNTLVSIKNKVTQVSADIKLLTQKMKKGGWQQKLRIQKITETFQEAMEICKPVEELVVEKMRQHMLPSELAVMGENVEQYLDNVQLTTSQMRQASEAMEFETGLLKEREAKMALIANTIIDVNTIMKELKAKVHEQGEDIDTIENAIEDVHIHVTQANEELEKASTYQINIKEITNTVEETNEDVASIKNDDSDFPSFTLNNNNNVIKDIRKAETGRRKTVCFLLALSIIIGVILITIIVVTLQNKKH